MTRPVLFQNIGLEIEYSNQILSPKKLDIINNLGWSLHHDASVMSRIPTLDKSTPVYVSDEKFSSLPLNCLSYNDMGGEIVSPISNPNSIEFINNLTTICSLLQNEGETSPRASVHVHINIGNQLNLHTLKSILVWGQLLEALIYRIFSVGNEHRGVVNNFNYCRPITSFGPPCVILSKQRHGNIFYVNDLLNSSSEDDFWMKMGDSINTNSKRMHPARYVWLNLMSNWKYGTLEWRPANLTLDPYIIRSLIYFCQVCTQLMYCTTPRLYNELKEKPINSLFNPLSDAENMEYFNMVIREFPSVYATFIDILLELYRTGSFPSITNAPVLSHMVEKDDYVYFLDNDYLPPTYPKATILKPVYQDLHNQQQRGIPVYVSTNTNKK
jgi:hypothetical protein